MQQIKKKKVLWFLQSKNFKIKNHLKKIRFKIPLGFLVSQNHQI